MMNMERSGLSRILLVLSLFAASLVNLCVADCSGFIFLCENSRIEVDGSVDMAPIRMPMTSSDCNEMPAAVEYCKSTLSTKPGQKIFARVGIFFAVGQPISPCDQSRHIMFSSNTDTINKQDRKCGDIPSETELFESVENSVVIEYNSNDGEDAAAIQVEAFGCATEDFQPPNPETTLDLSATNFGYSDNQYQGLLVCDTGYLMPDLADAKATYCRSSPIERTTRRRWQWDLPTEQTTCNRVSCDPIDIPTNGNYELSNQRYHGSVATFSCGTGFTLEGNTSQHCVVEPGAGGVWQGTAPTCKLVDCGQPDIPNARYTLPSITTFQSAFEYWCEKGLIPATGHARCGSDGVWSYTMCKEILCPVPRASSAWKKLSTTTLPKAHHVGSKISYSCIHDGSIASIQCEVEANGEGGKWTLLPACRKPDPTVAPIERVESATGAGLKRNPLVDRAGIIGGVISGLIFAIIIIIIACIFVRKSRAERKARHEAGNNNGSGEMKHFSSPDSTVERPPKPKRLYNGSAGGDSDVEKALITDSKSPQQPQPPQYANCVKHFHNRGNNRRMNGSAHTNSNHSNNNGTVSSRGSGTGDNAPHSDQASSVGMLDTGGDLYDSVMNGGKMNGKRTPSPILNESTNHSRSDLANHRNSNSNSQRGDNSANHSERNSPISQGRQHNGVDNSDEELL